MIGHVLVRRSDGGFHTCGVKQVAEHNRLAAVQLEIGVGEFTEVETVPVVGITELRFHVLPALAQHRDADFCRGGCHMHRCSADYKRDSALGGSGDAGARLPTAYVNAMIYHFLILLHFDRQRSAPLRE